MFFRTKTSGSRSYLQIVENRWEDGRTRQRVVATLGRCAFRSRSGRCLLHSRSFASPVQRAVTTRRGMVDTVGAGDSFQARSWTLGPRYRWINAIAVVFVILMFIILMLPYSSLGVPWEDYFDWSFFNYTPLVVGVVLLGTWLAWALGAIWTSPWPRISTSALRVSIWPKSALPEPAISILTSSILPLALTVPEPWISTDALRASTGPRSTCPACVSSAKARCDSARASPSWTGSPRARTAPPGAAESTCSSWPRTDGSRR